MVKLSQLHYHKYVQDHRVCESNSQKIIVDTDNGNK